MPEQIAVIGATGMLGRPVTNELLKAFPGQVRIIARNPTEVKHLFPDTNVVPGNMADLNSLVTALAGVKTVYLSLSVKQTEKPGDFHTETDGMKLLLQAASTAGVERIGYLSSLVMHYQGMNNFGWWVFACKHEAVQLLKASAIPYSIFYPSCFMDSLPNTQRMGNRIILVGQSAMRPWYVAASDYGRQVARAFQIAQPGQLQEYVIQGPAAITQYEAAERFVATYKKEQLTISTVPHWLLHLGSTVSQQAHYGANITEAINNYPEQFAAQQTWADLGKPLTTVEDFAIIESVQAGYL